ncbi:cellobiose 2-epimerase [Abditibacteriota bacterium]|nr:cellobiose 2-epimerase [Abditibacteriota bacterium]
MKRWLLLPLLGASLLPLHSARADDLNARATQIKSQLQTQWLPAWVKTSTANELATDAALNLQTLSHAHSLGYSTPQLDLLAAASAHYKLLRDSRRDKTNDGFYLRSQDSKEPTKSTLLQAVVVSALVEYARASGENEPRGLAVKIWRVIRDRTRDKINGGYYDSFYSAPPSATGASAFGQKSALTHLALLEAGTELYALTHDRSIRTDLVELLDLNQGRFFSVRSEESARVYSPDWRTVPQNEQPEQPNRAVTAEAGIAIVRAQTALGLPIGWVDFTRRVELEGTSANPATVNALTPLVKIASNREERATQLDSALDGLNTNAAQLPVDSGIPLLDFVAAFEK